VTALSSCGRCGLCPIGAEEEYLLQPGGDLERELKRSFWGGLLAGLAIAGAVYLYKRKSR
jgi:hypothetical protein